MKRHLFCPGVITSHQVYADGVKFDVPTQTYSTIGAIEYCALNTIDVFGNSGEGMTTVLVEFLEWFKNAPNIPKLSIYGKPLNADWGHGAAWGLRDADLSEDWLNITNVQATCAVIRFAVKAIDDSGFGWQKKARLFGVIEGAARRSGIGRVLSDSADSASTSVRSIRSLIAAGEAEDRGCRDQVTG